MVRYLGVTGHFRPEPLMTAINRFPFDTILMAVNAADSQHFSFWRRCCRWPSKSRWASSA